MTTDMIRLVAIGVVAMLLLDMVSRFAFYQIRDRDYISDDEFMALLPEGTSRKVALRVRAIVSEQCGVDYGLVRPDTTFIELTE